MNFRKFALCCALALFCSAAHAASYLIEAEDFQFSGEWIEERDTDALGNRMMRTPGAKDDAQTVIDLPQSGHYNVWVRARDYAEQPRTRRYQFGMDGELFAAELGAHGTAGWKWEKAGERDLEKGEHVLALHDTAKFFGRADAIYLTTETLDPNTQTLPSLAARRIKPKTVEAQPLSSFAPQPKIKTIDRAVAKLENEFVRVVFSSATDENNAPQIVRETELKIGDAWRKLAFDNAGEKLFLLSANKTELRANIMAPSWVSEPSTAPLYRFTAGGKDYQAMMGRSNPFFAAPSQALIAKNARQLDAQTVQVDYQTPDGTTINGRWTLEPKARDVQLGLDFAAPRDGVYSIGFAPFQSYAKGQIQFNLLPPVFQFQRLPETPVMIGSNSTPQPLALAQVENNGAPLSLGVLADPNQLPFRWASSDNSVYGFSLLNAENLVQPTIFAPVLGAEGSQFKRGEKRTVVFRVLAYPGDWKGALEYASNEVFQVTDYRKPYGVSLTDAALNMIDLMKDANASGWDAERKGFWNIETINVASQASPLTVLSAAILTRDEELYRTRALPSIEYTLSRPGAHFGMEVPDTHAAYINEAGTKIKVPSDFFGTAYWQGLHDLLGRKNEWIADLALDDGKVRYRTAYSSMPRWSEMLGAYRLKPDEKLLNEIKSEADKWLQSEVYGRKTRDLGLQPFYNVSYYPYWWDLLDLYEATNDKKYLNAAEESAFFTIAGLWSHPRVPEGNITIHHGGEYKGESHLWWKGDKEFRLGNPRMPNDTPEKQVPAWLVAQMGLGLEQPSTYYASGKAGMRNIMMAAWAPNLLRLYRYTGREIFRTYARNAIISRFGNYPGYYISGYTDLELAPDYPYKGPDVTSIYYHHIPPHLAFTLDFLVTEANQRSNGKIAFPWAKQEGYVWFANRVYDDSPGQVFDDNTARLWLSRQVVKIESPAINYLLAQGQNRVWLILMNEADSPQSPTITLNKGVLGLAGNDYTLYDSNGKSSTKKMQGALAVSVPAKGLIALSFPVVARYETSVPPLQNGRATQKLTGDWGSLDAFRIRSPFGKDSLYVVLTGRPKDGIATLQLEGAKPQEDKSYPYEWSVYPWPMERDLKFSLQLKDANGNSQTEPLILPGTPKKEFSMNRDAELKRTKPDYVVYVPQSDDGSTHDTGNEHFLTFDGPDGSLMAVWTQSTYEGKSDQRIMFSQSRDEGKTWETPKVIAGQKPPDSGPMASWGFPMVSKSGRIYVLYSRHVGINDLFTHTTGWLAGIYSDDNGKTWSQEQLVPMRRSKWDNPDPKIPPNIIIWQKPQRVSEGKYFTGLTRWVSPAVRHAPPVNHWTAHEAVVEFLRFENIDDDPEPRDIKISWFAADDEALRMGFPGYPEVSALQEPSIVALPDGRLFTTMRSPRGNPYYTVSSDAGRTWSAPQILRQFDDGPAFLHPCSPCPIYDLGAGKYLFLHHNHDGHFQQWGPFDSNYHRRPIFAALGEFRPGATQPMWFSEPTLMMDNDGVPLGFGSGRADMAMYASFTIRKGQRVLWYPDRKFFLVGRNIGNEWLQLAVPEKKL